MYAIKTNEKFLNVIKILCLCGKKNLYSQEIISDASGKKYIQKMWQKIHIENDKSRQVEYNRPSLYQSNFFVILKFKKCRRFAQAPESPLSQLMFSLSETLIVRDNINLGDYTVVFFDNCLWELLKGYLEEWIHVYVRLRCSAMHCQLTKRKG